MDRVAKSPNLSSPIVLRKYVFTRFMHEKERSVSAVVTGIAQAKALYSVYVDYFMNCIAAAG